MTKLVTAAVYSAGVLVFGLGLPSQAMAEQPIVVNGDKIGDPHADDLKIVCKRTIKAGTRMQTKRCETKQDWAKMEEAAKRAGKEMFDKPMIETRRD